MKIKKYNSCDELELTKLISEFRVSLAKLKGSERELDLKAAEKELEFYLMKKYPIFIAEGRKGKLIGFHVCKIQDDIIWSEALYVTPEERRKGVTHFVKE